MARFELTPEVMTRVAERFKALGEPTRLRILNALRHGERNVSEVMEATGLSQANVSKHLQLLHTLRYVERRREGLYVHYRIADESVFELCEIVCGRLEAETEELRSQLGAE